MPSAFICRGHFLFSNPRCCRTPPFITRLDQTTLRNLESNHFILTLVFLVLAFKLSVLKSIQSLKRELNLKKIISWFEYYLEIYNELAKADQINANHKNAFLDSIKDLPVVWNYDNKGGEIVKNGIVFEFNIHETHISQSIKLLYKVPNTLEAFFKLSENKY